MILIIEDDAEFKRIGDEYSSGKLLTGEVKAILIDEVTKLTKQFQKNRAEVTDATVAHFMDPTRPGLRHF